MENFAPAVCVNNNLLKVFYKSKAARQRKLSQMIEKQKRRSIEVQKFSRM